MLFWRDDAGQDLTEYTLLLAFVVLVSAALLLLNGNSIATIWHRTNHDLTLANSAVNP